MKIFQITLLGLLKLKELVLCSYRMVTNHELAEKLFTSDEWIFENLGIREYSSG
jgi:hypothetical protein